MVTFALKSLTQKLLEGKDKKQHEKTKDTTKPESKNRYPIIFVGGIGVSTTPDDLIKAFKSEGFQITTYPKIRKGDSFSFCPTVSLATNEQVDKILSIGELWVKDRFVEIREYKSRSKNKVVNRSRAQNPMRKKKIRPQFNRGSPCFRGINERMRARLQELKMNESNGRYDFPPNFHPSNSSPKLYPFLAPSPNHMQGPPSPMNPNPNMIMMPPSPNMFMTMHPNPNMFMPMAPSPNMHMPMAPCHMSMNHCPNMPLPMAANPMPPLVEASIPRPYNPHLGISN